MLFKESQAVLKAILHLVVPYSLSDSNAQPNLRSAAITDRKQASITESVPGHAAAHERTITFI